MQIPYKEKNSLPWILYFFSSKGIRPYNVLAEYCVWVQDSTWVGVPIQSVERKMLVRIRTKFSGRERKRRGKRKTKGNYQGQQEGDSEEKIRCGREMGQTWARGH